MLHLFMYVCVFTGDVPPTPLSPFEPHSTAIFSPVLRFTVKMERGVAILTKATDSLTPQVRGVMGRLEGKMGGRWRVEGGRWKMNDVGIEGGKYIDRVASILEVKTDSYVGIN